MTSSASDNCQDINNSSSGSSKFLALDDDDENYVDEHKNVNNGNVHVHVHVDVDGDADAASIVGQICDKLQYNNNNNNNNKTISKHNECNNENANDKKIIHEAFIRNSGGSNHNRMDDNSNDSSSGHEKSDAPEKLNKFEHDVTLNSQTDKEISLQEIATRIAKTTITTEETAATAAEAEAAKSTIEASASTIEASASTIEASASTIEASASTKEASASTIETTPITIETTPITTDTANKVNPSSTNMSKQFKESAAAAREELRKSYAFTVDYDTKEKDLDAKYKNMLERFQNRHKRGSSMSSEGDIPPTSTTSMMKKSVTQQLVGTASGGTTAVMRSRGGQDTKAKDFASKRRSWSPRSFEHTAKETTATTTLKQHQAQQRMAKRDSNQHPQPSNALTNKRPTSTTTSRMKATSRPSHMKKDVNTSTDDDEYYKERKHHYFKPRSTAMQLALKKVDYVCTKPLLDDFEPSYNKNTNSNKNNDGACVDKVSEAGTYTLEGDTYTEEQKEYMNIDREVQRFKSKRSDLQSIASNEPPQEHQYLNRDDLDDNNDEEDVGCVTSVTTSGVLSKSQHSSRSHKSMYGCVGRKSHINKCLDIINTVDKHQHNPPHHQRMPDEQSDIAILKTAQTKKDWVQEWARNARARSLANDYVSNVNNDIDEYDEDAHNGNDVDYNEDEQLRVTTPTSSLHSKQKTRVQQQVKPHQQSLMSQSLNNNDGYLRDPIYDEIVKRLFGYTRPSASNNQSNQDNNAAAHETLSLSDTSSLKSPTSQKNTKIPSPLHSNRRAKSSSRLTAENMDSTNLLNSPASSKNNHKLQRSDMICTQLPQHHAAKNLMTASYSEQRQPMHYDGDTQLFRQRKNSCDGNIDYQNHSPQRTLVKPLEKPAKKKSTMYKLYPHLFNPDSDYEYEDKSASLSKHQPSNDDIYVNNDDEQQDDDEYHDDDDDEVEQEHETLSEDPVVMSHYKSKYTMSAEPTNSARYNKTLLMRIQNSKQRQQQDNGIAACPNTPELPRRGIITSNRKSRVSPSTSNARMTTGRMSEPRDNSMCRYSSPHVPKSLDMAKKHLLQTAASATSSNSSGSRVQSAGIQPKYLDITRYQSPRGKEFLRKNEARSTLKSGTSEVTTSNIKRSPSGGLCRNDSTRTSKSSQRGAVPSCMTSSGTTLSGNAHGLAAFHNYQTSSSSTASPRLPASRFDSEPPKQKEAEMAMWKRRSKYDPMRAAAEDRRRKEELKRQSIERKLNN